MFVTSTDALNLSPNHSANKSTFMFVYSLSKWNVYIQGFRELKEGECIVRIAYAPINPSDINVLEGTYVIAPPSLPAVPGLEGSGVVVEIKEGQKLFDMVCSCNILLV